tara:strand:+ start:169 stop:939 length:771 start_codon:yes stop_codon:yes gene_type:complete
MKGVILINRRVARKKKTNLSGLPEEIEHSMEARWNQNYSVNQQYNLSEVHESFLTQTLNAETKMMLVDGPAGSSKTYLSVLASLLMLGRGEVDKIVYVRSIIESASRSLGSLPGDLEEKFSPWVMPLAEKVEELLTEADATHFMKSDNVECIPVNFARGLTFKRSAVIIDEAQNMTQSEITTLLTRFGTNSKYMLLGDTAQSDINGRSGFTPTLKAFDTKKSRDMGIYNIKFTKNEIVRSPILHHIVDVIEKIPKP